MASCSSASFFPSSRNRSPSVLFTAERRQESELRLGKEAGKIGVAALRFAFPQLRQAEANLILLNVEVPQRLTAIVLRRIAGFFEGQRGIAPQPLDQNATIDSFRFLHLSDVELFDVVSRAV